MVKKKIKIHLVKNQIYKLIAGVLAVFGLVMFVILYKNNLDGHPGILIEKPAMILVMFFPFIPSVVFLFLSKRERRRASGLAQNLK